METCKLHAVEPQAYIADVLTRLVNGHPNSRLNQLLPWAYVAEITAYFAEPRRATLHAAAKLPPTSPEYRALEHLRVALDGPAELMTGRGDTFVRHEGSGAFRHGRRPEVSRPVTRQDTTCKNGRACAKPA